ncbi:MAG: pectate lyase [Planctomycetaceae bacterium]
MIRRIPFLIFRLQVQFIGPTNQTYNVPGFFDGDGAGGLKGSVWRVRFTPDQAGKWKYQADLRSGPAVAIDLEANAGEAVELPGSTGGFEVGPRDPEAPGFLKWGRLEYVGKPYLKFRDGSYWLRGGTDEPEDLLGYAGFVNTPPKHRYAAHVEDWRPGDPDWGEGQGRGIIGALNYLASQHVNSIYFLTMNIGGDGKDVWPWLGEINGKGSRDNNHRHFDLEKLRQWETVFAHAQRQGLFLHVVFNEAEDANKRELDDGELGPERKLYYREMIARFGHHPAMQWNLCEEYNLNFDFGPERTRAFADFVLAVDPYDHSVTVHSAGDPVEKLRFTFGDPRFSMTSIQLNQRPIHDVTEAIRNATIQAGRPLPVSLDEFTLDRGQRASHIPVDDADGHRREKIWPTYFSGGMIEFILGDLLKTDNFKTPEREKLWQYLWNARKFTEMLPFWEMEPSDGLAAGGGTIAVGIGKGKTVPLGPQVFAKTGEIYAVYLPTGVPSGTLNLADLKGPATQQWYNPRTGDFTGEETEIMGGGNQELGAPPAEPDQDWVVLIRQRRDRRQSAIDPSGFRDSASHWRKIRDDNRVIQAEPDQPAYSPDQVREIVANILLFQRDNGGWAKDYDMLAILTDAQQEAVASTRARNDTSFDNRNIHSQVNYLAWAYAGSPQETSWRDACLRGWDFMVRAQMANGGFPQRFPLSKGYAGHITFNDGAMMGILNVFQDAIDRKPQWDWLDESRRQHAQSVVERAVDCILKCQIEVDGIKTGWCQQHDEQTFAPASARTFELASICPQETAEICRFLMRQQPPSANAVEAVDAAVRWMKSVALKGIRVERVPAPKEEFLRHRANFDVVVQADEAAQPIWARHYEIGTNRPIFAGRDAVKRYALSEIERERRTGTRWYGDWPADLLAQEYPAWRKTIGLASPTGNP